MADKKGLRSIKYGTGKQTVPKNNMTIEDIKIDQLGRPINLEIVRASAPTNCFRGNHNKCNYLHS